MVKELVLEIFEMLHEAQILETSPYDILYIIFQALTPNPIFLKNSMA
jgi:hypothetical protein